MLKIKKSGSGILLTKINKFDNLRNGYAYNKNYEKINHIAFEIEKQKEIMIKLKSDLNNKNKELNELLSNNQIEKNKHNKKIKLIEEILSIHENNTESKKITPKLKIDPEIENNIINSKIQELKEKEIISTNNTNNINTVNDENEIYNKTNSKTFYTTNNNFTNKNHFLPKIKSPRIKSKLFINTNTFMKKKKLKDILYITTLRNQIHNLNEKLEKKQEEILDYKTKHNDENNSTNIEKDILSDYDKIKELKYKNAEMCANLEDFAENYFLQREENSKLKNKLNDFIDVFNNYKESTEKNNLYLEEKLKYYEEKNLKCLIFHQMNKNKNSSRFYEDNRSKLTEAGNIIEKINEEIEEINNDLKLKNNNFNLIKNDVENLNNKKKEINENMEKNKANINEMNIKKEESDKKNKEKENVNKNLKKEYKDRKNKYKNIINKIKDAKDLIKEKDKEINELKEEIEKLKSSKNVFYY